jgi:transcription elongation factor GreA
MEKEIIFLTKEGHALIQKELEQAKKILYDEIPSKLKASKVNGGDLRENKEYIYLQSEQQYYEREVRRLTSVLEASQIIADEEISDEEIGIGSSFILQDLEIMESGSFSLVSSAEVDLEKGKISVDSPVGKALIGKREGDEIAVDLPAGKVHFRVIAINKR